MSRRVEIELARDGLNKCANCMFYANDNCFQPKELDCGIDAMDEHWEIVKEDEE
jgi:hypothetical protein